MSKRSVSLSMKNMVAAPKARSKVVTCSTPEHGAESPSRESDSICDSEAASPVSFLCTQDGAEGETDVVWNYYTPKAEHSSNSRLKKTEPASRKSKKAIKKIIERPLPKRRPIRNTQRNTELFQDLIELNQNIHKLIEKKTESNYSIEKHQAGSEDDLFSYSSDCSPKSVLKSNTRCLRKNLLSSKFNKPESETALESDDSMNECLIKASQIVEENILPAPTANINHCNFQDSMDGILSSIKLESPVFSKKSKKVVSPSLNNDSFDSFVGNLNDSALERLTQMPAKNTTPRRQNTPKNQDSTSSWVLQELRVHESSPSTKNIFGRHSSMPESPSVTALVRPSTSGMIFGRYNSMPLNQNEENKTGSGDSPIRCTPEEIRKKHIQAREKLLAKRQLPFTSMQSSNSSQQVPVPKKSCFQPKVKSISSTASDNKLSDSNNTVQKGMHTDESNLKKIIEKKRQEALMKLRRKQSR